MDARVTKAGAVLLGAIGLFALSATSGFAGEQFHGLVLGVKVDECGGSPGTCRGSVVIGYCEAGVLRVRVEPGSTTIRRDGREVELPDLKYGDKALAELAGPLPPQGTPGYERPGGVAKVIEVR